MLKISHEKINTDTVKISLTGALTNKGAIEFENKIANLLNETTHNFLLDCQNLEFLSSDGIGTLIFVQKKITAYQGKIIIFNLNQEISLLLDVLKIKRFFIIVENEENAFLSLHEKRKNKAANFSEKEDVIKIEIENKANKKNEETIPFSQPLIIECAKCKNLIRVKNPGTFLCPECQAEFIVKNDSSVIF